MPKMRHKSGGRSIDVGPDQVPMYESQGWEVQAARPRSPRRSAKKKTSAQTTATKATVATNKE